ncbi:hypothetical protein HRG_006023 [Hirsutella rhossiliensis]|uniref:Ankyrin 2,3/unc44 n=1 Tax=Hirsutella rhossiliensis TaxID=111463 RepID=A0A9P8SHU7_9HYPO|nr:uncharacterized protein HRG_06023 [Hirsutella rhossiliensis]KAH0963513.1 hypothetical protein HRG_06023 [Hirsutella rhossiliensis]
MSFSESASPTLTVTVEDIAAWSDERLGRFMDDHRGPDGEFCLPVDDWTKLSQKERQRLAERLRAQQEKLAQSAASRPLDLDRLDALLRQIPDGPDTARRAQSPISGIETPFIDFEKHEMEDEMEAYQNLVNDGGRPLYPIDLLEQVSTDVHLFSDMLQPWLYPDLDTLEWQVFGRQWARWEQFRKWQNDHRGLEDDDGGFPAFVERLKRLFGRSGNDTKVAELEANPSCVTSNWEWWQGEREKLRNRNREPGCNSFFDYADAMRRRLARHGFTGPFDLKETPKHQDSLTTWTEYLYFEYWSLDWYDDRIKQDQPLHDKAWQELLDSQVLEPGDTPEILWSSEHDDGQDRWQEAVFAAKNAAAAEVERVHTLTQVDPDRHNMPESDRSRMMREATENLAAAEKESERCRERGDQMHKYARQVRHFRLNRRDMAYHEILVEWVRQQVLLVAAESTQAKSTTGGAKKRELASVQEEQRSKKRKPNGGERGATSPTKSRRRRSQDDSPVASSRPPPSARGSLSEGASPSLDEAPVAEDAAGSPDGNAKHSFSKRESRPSPEAIRSPRAASTSLRQSSRLQEAQSESALPPAGTCPEASTSRPTRASDGGSASAAPAKDGGVAEDGSPKTGGKAK